MSQLLKWLACLAVAAAFVLPDAGADFQEYEGVGRFTADPGNHNDRYGSDVAVHGNRLLVGADGVLSSTGAVYVYERAEDRSWSGGLTFQASDGSTGDRFGFAVDVHSDAFVVGAPYDDDAGDASGSAYIYWLNETGIWNETKITPPDAEAGDRFGASVAMDGDTVIIGAPGADVTHEGALLPDAGKAYTFAWNGAEWTYTSTFTQPTPGDHHAFGGAVATHVGAFLIGASGDDHSGGNAGSAHLFAPDGAGGHTGTSFLAIRNAGTYESPTLINDFGTNQHFGSSVALYGGAVVIGAWGDDDHGARAGAVYTFHAKPDGAWLPAKITAPDARGDQRFGNSIALAAGELVVGAWGDGPSGTFSGSVYEFHHVDLNVTFKHKTNPADGKSFHFFGRHVDVDSGLVVASAHGFNDDWRAIGAAYLMDTLFDSDGDGLADYQEAYYGALSYNPDTDGDGLRDGDEVHIYGSDPDDEDTDGDLYGDKQEVECGSNPANTFSIPRPTCAPVGSEVPFLGSRV